MLDERFVMSYFTTSVEQLHLAVSEDGHKWSEVNGGEPVLHGSVGQRTLRDPFIAADRDGVFHLLATNGWASRSIVHAESDDLLTWSEQTLIPVMETVPGAMNAWAPEFFANPDGGYCVLWSSVVDDSVPLEDWHADDWRVAPSYDQRIWMSLTPDFTSWSAPRVFFDPGYPVIDASVDHDGQRFVMAFKDERGTNAELGAFKGIRITSFDSPGGAFDPPTAIISGEEPAEGPTVFAAAGGLRIIFDRYQSGGLDGLSSAGGDWSQLDALETPDGARHPTVRAIPSSLYERLRRV